MRVDSDPEDPARTGGVNAPNVTFLSRSVGMVEKIGGEQSGREQHEAKEGLRIFLGGDGPGKTAVDRGCRAGWELPPSLGTQAGGENKRAGRIGALGPRAQWQTPIPSAIHPLRRITDTQSLPGPSPSRKPQGRGSTSREARPLGPPSGTPADSSPSLPASAPSRGSFAGRGGAKGVRINGCPRFHDSMGVGNFLPNFQELRSARDSGSRAQQVGVCDSQSSNQWVSAVSSREVESLGSFSSGCPKGSHLGCCFHFYVEPFSPRGEGKGREQMGVLDFSRREDRGSWPSGPMVDTHSSRDPSPSENHRHPITPRPIPIAEVAGDRFNKPRGTIPEPSLRDPSGFIPGPARFGSQPRILCWAGGERCANQWVSAISRLNGCRQFPPRFPRT